jgi:hypothetical protein
MHKKKPSISICLSIIAVMLMLPAALSAEEKMRCRRDLEPGSWSLQFQIADDINLRAFNGMMISVKRHFNERSAIRLGLNLDLDSDRRIEGIAHSYRDTLREGRIYKRDDSEQSIQLNLFYMRYPNPGGRIKLFYGAGPLVSFSRRLLEYERNYYGSGRYDIKESNWERYWAVGLNGILGAEWFATDGISFHAEYRAVAKYTRGRYESDEFRFSSQGKTATYSETETDYWNFDASYVTFGISLYF